MENNFKPIELNERHKILDVLRGFAIFGILMVNMPLFNSPFFARIANFELFPTFSNQLTTFFIRFFFEGKFFTLFSILFGIGFYIFLNKKVEESQTIIPTYRRRIFYLLLFGILHICLLWFGDILFFYAIFGFILILFKRKSERGLMKWAIAMIAFPVILTIITVLFIQLGKMNPDAAKQIDASMLAQSELMKQLTENALKVYPSGSFSEIFYMRLDEWSSTLGGLLFFYPNVFAMFLFGFYIAKKGWFWNISENKSVFRKMMWYGLIFGIIGNLMYTIGMRYSSQMNMNTTTVFSMLGFSFGVPALTLFYISAVALLFEKGFFQICMQSVSFVGRMALTNYLLQSIICTTLFYSYGFGLYGKLNLWQGVILVFVIYLLQIIFSKYWLSKFYYGPFEWIWRSLTYRKMQKFKIK